MSATIYMLEDELEAAGIPAAFEGGHAGFSFVVPIESIDAAFQEMRAWGRSFSDTLFIGDRAACERMSEAHPDASRLRVSRNNVNNACRIASHLAAKCLQWQLDIAEIGAGEASYQDIIDASEQLTGNPVILSDAAFRIIAYSRNAIPSVPFVKDAIERGAFDSKTMELFRRRRRPSNWKNAQGISVLDEANSDRPYPVISYVFRVNGHYFMQLAMHCSTRPLSDGLRDAFTMMIGAIESLISKASPTSGLFDQGLAKALADAAMGKRPLSLKRTDRETLAKAGLGDGAPLRLVVCDFGYSTEDHQLPKFAAFQLSQQFPDAFVFICEMKVALLVREGEGDRAFPARAQLAGQIEAAVEEKRVVCGVSDAFDALEDVRFAFMQGEAACALCRDETVATFHDAFARYALRSGRDEALMEWCLARSVPARLCAEADGPASDFALLRCFLANERRATAAAELVHLHRTSLVYRIERIEKRFSIDLDHAPTRNRILIEYALIENGC